MLRKSLIGLAIVALLGVLTPAAAVANAPGSAFRTTVDRTGGAIHTCPNSNCPVAAYMPVGRQLIDLCWITGPGLQYNKPYWDLVYDIYSDSVGYINEAWLARENQAHHCGNTSGYTAGEGGTGAGIHACAGVAPACPVRGMADGFDLTILCWTASDVALDGSIYWNLVYNHATGVAGWTHQYWLTANAPRGCNF